MVLTITEQDRKKGENLSNFISSCFYQMKHNDLVMLGLKVDQLQNGSYQLSFIIDAVTKEKEETEQKEDSKEVLPLEETG